jgi:hypothetical protein
MGNMAPQRNEAWRKVMDAATLSEEKFSDAFKVAFALEGDKPRPGSIGFECRVQVAGGTTDDTEVRVYSCPDGDPDLRSSVAEDARLLATAVKDPLLANFWCDWQTVVSGAQISLKPTGATVDMVGTIWIRRFWMGNPARM